MKITFSALSIRNFQRPNDPRAIDSFDVHQWLNARDTGSRVCIDTKKMRLIR